MNKLLLSLSLIFAATFAPAACYTWGLMDGGNAKSSSDTYLLLDDFTVMLFTGVIGQTDNGNGTWFLDFAAATYITQASTFDAGSKIVGELSFDKNRTHDAVTGDADQPYYLLILDTGKDITDYANYKGSYALVSGEGGLNQDPTSSINYAEFKYYEAITSDMYKTAAGVPEPTSGLLMLLGLSALALRRKRA